jgi:hypothetical protein
MFSIEQKKSSSQLLFPLLILLTTCIGEARAQQGGTNHPTMRDQARAIQRSDMDRLLLASMPKQADTESSRATVMKQIRADFKELQELNNRMMAEAWARETLDYSYLSGMVSRIRGKAIRLKTNMNLPELGNIEKTPSNTNASNSREFRAALLTLDRTVMSFVTNPLFKEPETIEMTQATRARQDLESVIELTATLKKIGSRLAKIPSK